MADEDFDDIAGDGIQPEADDLKKKAVAQSTQASGLTPEDQSRGVLHYGETHEGDATSTSLTETAFFQDGSSEPSMDEDVIQDPNSVSAETTPRVATASQDPDRQSALEEDIPKEAESRPSGDADKSSAQSVKPGGFDGGSATNEAEPGINSGVGGHQGTEVPDEGSEEERGQATADEDAEAGGEDQTSAGSDVPEKGESRATERDKKIEDVNDAPSQLTLSNHAIEENAEGAIVGTLSVTDPDANETHSFAISDDRFEIVDGQVKLKDGVSLDHEEVADLAFEIVATDSGGNSVMQRFEIAVEDVNETPTQLSLSNSAVAESTDGAVVGFITVTDEDIGDSHSFVVSDDRFEVLDGQVKLKDGVSLDHEEAASLTLEVTAIDSEGNTFDQSFEIAVADVPDVTLGTGFHAKYFDMNQSIRAIDDVDWDGPVTHQELVDDIDYTNSANSFWDGGSRDTFGVQITGNIEVEEGGVYNFHIGGDDGVVLYIDGKEVVDNDGLHGFRTRSGEVELEPGAHVIEVRYFENYGHAGLKVEWEGPDTDGRELLSSPEMDDLQTVNGMPVTVNLETDMSEPINGEYSQVIEGLPPGTVVQAGEVSVDVDESGSADISGWDTSMLMITPPVDFTGRAEAQVSTKVTLESGDSVVSTADLSFDVDQADIAPPPPEMQAGFRASYFDVDHSLNRLDQIDWDADPTKEEVIGEINYANGRDSFWEGGSKDTFGARITGEITVDEAGEFDFFLGGDDGVVLYIDGVEVIDNDRLHSYRTRSGEIELEAGTHEIEIRYFENYGHAGLKLEWEGPGIDGRELVHADTELAVPENGALDLQLNNVDVGGSGSVVISGLPADTILVSGDNSVVSDGAELDLSGWDLDLIELMPPPGFEGVISAEVLVSDAAFNGEEFQTSNTFEIEVGDVENQSQTESSHEDLLLAEEAAQDDGNPGWADEPVETDDDEGDDADDDVMDEPVSETSSSEQSHEMTETYERNDW